MKKGPFRNGPFRLCMPVPRQCGNRTSNLNVASGAARMKPVASSTLYGGNHGLGNDKRYEPIACMSGMNRRHAKTAGK